MAAPLSMGLRKRLVRAVEQGSSAREAARRFDVSRSAAIKLVSRVRRTVASIAVRFRITDPPRLWIDSVVSGEDVLVVTARSTAATISCPLCGIVSHRVQSRYVRQSSDLPFAGCRVRLRFLVRRFRCGVSGCLRGVFAEQFDTRVLVASANYQIDKSWN